GATRIDARTDALEPARRTAHLQGLATQQVVTRIVGHEGGKPLALELAQAMREGSDQHRRHPVAVRQCPRGEAGQIAGRLSGLAMQGGREAQIEAEEHTSELQSLAYLVCR